MKIALYVPYIPDENSTPPLGPLYLLSVIEKNGFEGRLFDARIDTGALEKLIEFKPDAVGISAVTAAMNRALDAARLAKKDLGGIPVIFGGPHPTALPESVIKEDAVDYVLTGESEFTFLGLLNILAAGNVSRSSLEGVHNLYFKDNGTIAATPQSSFLSPEELDRLPLPAFHLMDLGRYFSNTQTHGLFRKGKRILPIMSSRGCPSSCTFCCRVMGKSIRARSVDAVMAEVEYIVKQYGIDEIFFEDDNFTILRRRALEILERLAALRPKLHVKFANGVRADLVDEELLKSMKRAGVYSLSFGIESGCKETLSKMHKNLDLEKARKNILLAKSLGFFVGSNCIIGYPGETARDVEESLAFFASLPLDSMAIVNLVPFPGTEARRICEENGYLTKEASNWDNYYFSINDPIPLIDSPSLPAAELRRLVKKAYSKMYFNPRWVLRSIAHLSPSQVLKGARMLLLNPYFALGARTEANKAEAFSTKKKKA